MTYHEKVRRNELSCERQMMTLIERRIKHLESENERLRRALIDIIKHQEIVGVTLAQKSMVVKIAKEALNGSA